MSGDFCNPNNDISIKAEMDSVDASMAGTLPRQHKRRPHTKSRNGCTTCKRRRVKCDETRPICRNCQHLRLECRYVSPASLSCADLQIMNLKLLHHYDRVVSKTISDAGISTEDVWARDVVDMGFRYPFLMHAILMFSATHLAQREPKEFCNAVVQHRSEALSLLRNEVQRINSENLDPLVATSVLLILDAMANASLPSRMTPSSLPASTWLHHVRGAATILLAVGVLPPTSKFYSFMGVDLLDLANCYTKSDSSERTPPGFSSLQCFMPELSELYPVPFNSPYFSSLVFLDKLQSQRGRADFILRVFSFPALMDKEFVRLLAAGDKRAKLIVGSYYRLVRQFVNEMHDRVWFLNGVSTVLPIDMDNEFGGLGFVTDALPISQNVDSILAKFDASFAAAENRIGAFHRQQMANNPSIASAYGNELLSGGVFDDLTGDGRSCISESYAPSGNDSGQSSTNASPPTAPPTAPGSLAGSPQSSANLQGMPNHQQQTAPLSGPAPQSAQSSTSSLPSFGLPPSQTHLSEVMPHIYGRIHKHSSTPAAGVPGLTNRVVNRSRPPSRLGNVRTTGLRNRNIIRPGMMGLPVDPSIADDLLSGLEFGEDYINTSSNSGNEEDANFGFRDIVFDTDTLEWKTPPQQARFNIDTNNNNAYMSLPAQQRPIQIPVQHPPSAQQQMSQKGGSPQIPGMPPSGTQLSTPQGMQQNVQSAMRPGMQNTGMQNSGMQKQRIQSPGMQNSQMQNSQMQNSQMQNSQMQNSQMQNSQMQNSHMQNSQMQNQQMQNSGMRHLGEIQQQRGMQNSGMPVPNMPPQGLQNPGLQSPGMQSSNMSTPMTSMRGDSLVADPFGSSQSLGMINPIKQEIMDHDFQSIIDLDDDPAIADNYEWTTNRA